MMKALIMIVVIVISVGLLLALMAGIGWLAGKTGYFRGLVDVESFHDCYLLGTMLFLLFLLLVSLCGLFYTIYINVEICGY